MCTCRYSPQVILRMRKNFSCKLRNKQFKTKKNLDKHFHKNNEVLFSTCDYCGFKFTGTSRKTDLSSHIDIHRKYSILQCRVCNSNFTTAKILKEHLKGFHLSPKVCEFCAKTFPRMIELNFHIEAKHQTLLKYKCPSPQCSRMFATKKIARDHATRIHRTKEDTFKCRDCSESFLTREDLRVHSFDHYTGKIFTCAEENCGKFFKTNASLNLHLRSHSDEKLYKCLKCEKRFVQSSGLGKHMKRCKGPAVKKKEETMEPEEIVRIAREQYEEILKVKGKLTKNVRKIESTKIIFEDSGVDEINDEDEKNFR